VSHQGRLPAYRSGALSRSGLERVNSAVEWHMQNRCFLTRKIVRDGVPIKAMGPVCSSLSPSPPESTGRGAFGNSIGEPTTDHAARYYKFESISL
jgi:hypothetical protein